MQIIATDHPSTLSALVYDRTGYTDTELLELYRAILLPRMIEEKMLILLRQNRISKWFSGIGQEAISVGVTQALKPKDFIFPLHRNLGVFTGRGMDFRQIFTQWQGGTNGFTKGRDRSFHFGSPEHRVIGMISHLGAMLGVGDGVALASNLSEDDYIAVAFSGDGGASEGDFHEAINTAAVWDLPVIFLVENNGYGLSTPSTEQFRCKQFIDKAIGFGIEGVQVDGNDLLAVHTAVRTIARKMRMSRKPVLLECMTFRMRGHEEASGTKYVPKDLQDAWAAKDPVANYEKFLISQGILKEASAQAIRAEFKTYIEDGLNRSFAEAPLVADLQREMADVYAPRVTPIVEPDMRDLQEMRFIDAISDGLKHAMRRDPKLVLMGQDIAEYGGVFKITQGFVEEFGKERVRNTPLCESAILACGMGLTLGGYRAMVEMQFADFVSCGFNQIVNNLAKTHYRWQHAVPVMVRMPTGAGSAAGPFHSQSNEAWFFHVPGLKIVYPSNPFDAKGLLLAGLDDPNPVLYFEHKMLYRSVAGQVPSGYYQVPIGQAAVVRPGADATVITYGMGVQWALQAATELANEANIEVIDLRSLLPWDKEAVYASVRKTGKALVLHEDTLTGGIGAEIAACIAEEMFQQLDAPVARVASLDTPVPFNPELEKQFLPQQRLAARLRSLIQY